MAVVQAVAGVFVTGGCLCEPNFRVTGLVTAVVLGAVTAALAAAGLWARKAPRAAAWVGVGVQIGVIAYLSVPGIAPPSTAWYLQIVAAMLAVTALALRH